MSSEGEETTKNGGGIQLSFGDPSGFGELIAHLVDKEISKGVTAAAKKEVKALLQLNGSLYSALRAELEFHFQSKLDRSQRHNRYGSEQARKEWESHCRDFVRKAENGEFCNDVDPLYGAIGNVLKVFGLIPLNAPRVSKNAIEGIQSLIAQEKQAAMDECRTFEFGEGFALDDGIRTAGMAQVKASGIIPEPVDPLSDPERLRTALAGLMAVETVTEHKPRLWLNREALSGPQAESETGTRAPSPLLDFAELLPQPESS